MKQRGRFRVLVIYLILLALLFWAFTAFNGGQKKDYIGYSAARDYFLAQQVTAFDVDKRGVLSMQLSDGSVKYHALADTALFYDDLGTP